MRLLECLGANVSATYLPAALALGRQDAWLLYQPGSVYAAIGDTAQARTLLTAALDLNPQFDLDHAQRARDLFAGLGD